MLLYVLTGCGVRAVVKVRLSVSANSMQSGQSVDLMGCTSLDRETVATYNDNVY